MCFCAVAVVAKVKEQEERQGMSCARQCYGSSQSFHHPSPAPSKSMAGVISFYWPQVGLPVLCTILCT